MLLCTKLSWCPWAAANQPELLTVWFTCYLHSDRSCDYCPSSLYITYSKYFCTCLYANLHVLHVSFSLEI